MLVIQQVQDQVDLTYSVLAHPVEDLQQATSMQIRASSRVLAITM